MRLKICIETVFLNNRERDKVCSGYHYDNDYMMNLIQQKKILKDKSTEYFSYRVCSKLTFLLSLTPSNRFLV